MTPNTTFVEWGNSFFTQGRQGVGGDLREGGEWRSVCEGEIGRDTDGRGTKGVGETEGKAGEEVQVGGMWVDELVCEGVCRVCVHMRVCTPERRGVARVV